MKSINSAIASVLLGAMSTGSASAQNAQAEKYETCALVNMASAYLLVVNESTDQEKITKHLEKFLDLSERAHATGDYTISLAELRDRLTNTGSKGAAGFPGETATEKADSWAAAVIACEKY